VTLGFRLLAISPGAVGREPEGEERLLSWLDALAAWVPAVAVQIREKQLDDRAGHHLLQRARERFPGVLLVNGRADLAVAVGADGVHLPSAGVPAAAIRDRWGGSLLVGRSAHSAEEVAGCAGVADYVCLGPVFATPSKPGTPPLGLEALTAAAGLGPAVFALGGIDDAVRVGRALAAGADGVAGIRLFAAGARLAGIVRAAAPDRALLPSTP
jgi:thiamine-phosphate pyrophosphorylase